jgi:hypothetical protein
MTDTGDHRKTHVLLGAALFATITLVVTSLIIGWRLVPGLLGEWLGIIAGLVSTPFLLETTFVILGFVIVIALNGWRRTRDGDEFVYLEQVKGPDLPENLPDQAKWAVFKELPLPGVMPSLLERAEGAVAIGDFESAAALIAAMNHGQLAEDGVLEVRIALARASGKSELAARLEGELAARAKLS